MDIFLQIILLILGIVLLIWGADFFVNGASAVAKKLKVPAIIIGLTVVAIGTSLPELAISVISAISGSTDLSIGNIIGSNMSNMLLIIGITACISPILVKKTSRKFDFPILILVTLLLFLFGSDSIFDSSKSNIINRVEGIILLLVFVFYIVSNIINAKRERRFTENFEKYNNIEQKNDDKNMKVWMIIISLILGLGAVVFGGECVSSSAQFLAAKAGMSDSLIGITIVALGTSLPELATAVVAAKKGENDLAVGNILGSNILNIVLILGAVATIRPIGISKDMFIDLIVLFVSTLIFTLLALRKNKLGKIEGSILIIIYVLYIAFSIIRNYCL